MGWWKMAVLKRPQRPCGTVSRWRSLGEGVLMSLLAQQKPGPGTYGGLPKTVRGLQQRSGRAPRKHKIPEALYGSVSVK